MALVILREINFKSKISKYIIPFKYYSYTLIFDPNSYVRTIIYSKN